MGSGSVNKSFEPDGDNKKQATSKHADFKHLQEHYDEITDNKLPDYLHRGDITSVNRFLGYHDAMMATCGTFLVLPLRNLNNMVLANEYEELKKNHHLPHDPIVVDDLAGYIHAMRLELIMFFLGFLVICTIWESNNIRTIVIKRYDDFLIFLGIAQMFSTLVLPFSIALQGHWPDERVTVLITMITLIITSVIELVMIVYGFSCPRLLNMAINDYDNKERRNLILLMCLKPVFDICLVGIAGALAVWDFRASWVLITLLVLWPIFRNLGFYLRRKYVNQNKQENCRFYYYYSKGQISKERLEAFTDAAVAIIACVLMLDITVEEFPTSKKVDEEGLLAVLNHMLPEFRGFFGTYLIVSTLWYVNHTVINLFHTVDSVVLYLQKFFLAFLCLNPLSSSMYIKFSTKGEDTKVSTLWMNAMGITAAMTQVFMLCWGYYRGEKLIHSWSTYSERVRHSDINRKQFLYVRLKLAVFPFWALVGFSGYFATGKVPAILTTISTLGGTVTFIALKFIFMNHIGKKSILHHNDSIRQPSGDQVEMRRELEKEVSDGQVFDNEEQVEASAIKKAEKEEIEKQIQKDNEEIEKVKEQFGIEGTEGNTRV